MSVLVIALHKNGQLNSATLEAVTAAATFGEKITVAVLSDSPDSIAAGLSEKFNGTIVTIANQSLAAFNDETYANVLTELIGSSKPKVVLVAATLYGKAMMSRLAAMLKSPMISDVTAIRVDGPAMVASRPSFGGSVLSEMRATFGSVPICLSIRPKIFPQSVSGTAAIETYSLSPKALESKTKVTDVKIESSGTVTLADADRVVSAGRGIKGPENVPMVEALAKSVGAAFGASRAVVDAGWVPYAHQVGQTGRTVNPKLYIAVGVSGAIQHLVGMQSSQTIVAINKDKDAPIFKVATYGIVGDLFEVVPALTKKFETELSR